MMWRWILVWQATVLLVGGTPDIRFFNTAKSSSTAQINCVDYPWQTDFSYNSGWRARRMPRAVYPTQKYWLTPRVDGLSRRLDFLLSNQDEIIKEHAKLVHDINGMRQVVFVAPLADETKDYDESIFHEIIETTSTTSRPPAKPSRSKSGIPGILFGGISQRQHLVMSPPLKLKQSINLVGSSVTPLVKHPYPFVTAPSSRHPVKICMSTPMTYSTTTKRPSLWEKLIKAIIPKYIG